MLKFIKSQLEYDWRKPLVKELNKIKGGNVWLYSGWWFWF
jgi:hypothetical protein